MLISYENNKIKKIFNKIKHANNALPFEAASNLQQRLFFLSSFDDLGSIPLNETPLRFHSVTKKFPGCYAIRISAKHRIVFKPCGEYENLPDGSANLDTVTEIEIVAIGDYHDA